MIRGVDFRKARPDDAAEIYFLLLGHKSYSRIEEWGESLGVVNELAAAIKNESIGEFFVAEKAREGLIGVMHFKKTNDLKAEVLLDPFKTDPQSAEFRLARAVVISPKYRNTGLLGSFVGAVRKLEIGKKPFIFIPTTTKGIQRIGLQNPERIHAPKKDLRFFALNKPRRMA